MYLPSRVKFYTLAEDDELNRLSELYWVEFRVKLAQIFKSNFQHLSSF